MGNLCAVFGLPVLTLQLGRSLFCLVLSNHKRSRARVPVQINFAQGSFKIVVSSDAPASTPKCIGPSLRSG